MNAFNPNRTLELDDLFLIGDHVLIDDTATAWIREKKTVENTILLKIQYDLTKFHENEVTLDRVKVVPYPYIITHRPRHRNNLIPNSDIRHHNSDRNNSDISDTQEASLQTVSILQQFHILLKQSFTFKSYNKDNNMKLYLFLKDGKSKEKGWLRDIIANKTVKKKTFLSVGEHHLLNTVACLFSGHTSTNGQFRGFCSYICKAFGITYNTLTHSIDKFISTNYTMKRAIRIDKGKTIFNCEKKRKARFTAYNTFKKRKLSEFRETTEKIPDDIIKNGFDNLDNNELAAYEILAERDRSRAVHLWDELKDLLLKTKGKISYKTMRQQLGSIVSENTIRKWLKRQDGFRLRRDRILPSLDAAAKLRRLVWTHSFWLFWLSARLIPIEKAIMVVCHMDEKWFYAVRTRCNTKVLTSIGLEPNDYYAHHKNHIGKEMYICVTAFVLTNNNDIRMGGTAVPVSMIRVGKMVCAAKDTYKRVYKPNGKFHYPKIAANKLRTKGQFYFKALELTGSSEGTDKCPKVSLLKCYKEQIIPDMERKIKERFSNGGSREVIILKQEDGAGLHTHKTYIKEMKSEFWEKRGWLLFNQSSQSPTFNVHDSCIFPMMSKHVSREQALTFGSRLLKGEQLYETVMKVWQDPANLIAISRSFAGHWQIVCAAMHHKGDNMYLKEKGGLSFGIRRTFIGNERGDGIIPVSLAPESEGETLSGSLLLENQISGLKYKSPPIQDLVHARLTGEMMHVLDTYMDKSSISEEHEAALKDQNYNCETESDIDVDLENSVLQGEDNDDNSTSDDSGFSTETECESNGSSITLGEIHSQSFDTVSDAEVEIEYGIE